MTNLLMEKENTNVVEAIETREVLGQQFKIYGTYDEPLFLAKDVAGWIDYDKSSINKMINSVDDDEKVRNIIPTLKGNQNAWFLTEDGLYEVLLQSRKPIAKQFKKQVKQILKEIRKHGIYATDEVTDKMIEDPDWGIRLLKTVKAERQKRLLAEQQIKELQPKVTYYDSILNNTDTVTVSQIAKDYGISAKKLNSILAGLNIQYKQSKQWLLYSKYQSFGYTQSKTSEYTLKNGQKRVSLLTKWTQKGRIFLYHTLKDNGYLPMIEQ